MQVKIDIARFKRQPLNKRKEIISFLATSFNVKESDLVSEDNVNLVKLSDALLTKQIVKEAKEAAVKKR